MHKKIVGILTRIIDESPYNFCDYKIIDNPTRDGFWKLNIYLYDKHNAHSAAFLESIRHIGTVYGEGLSIEEDGHSIRIA